MLASMLRQAVECSLTCLASNSATWIKQGIAKRENVAGIDLTDKCRSWLSEHVGHGKWHWDWFWEEDELEMHFRDPKHAMLFKLTWL